MTIPTGYPLSETFRDSSGESPEVAARKRGSPPPTMACILVLATAFVAPPVTVHRHRVNDLHINALTDVNLLIEAAVGIFGAGFAGWKMSQDGKDAEPSAAITAKMPPLDGKVVSSWYDSGMRLTSEAIHCQLITIGEDRHRHACMRADGV